MEPQSSQPLRTLPLPALADNYICLVHNSSEAVAVDPGDDRPVLAELGRLGLRLTHVLLTHHHGDHAAGAGPLKRATGCVVLGPDDPRLTGLDRRLGDHDELTLLGARWAAWSVPGHTRTHLAFLVEQAGVVFTGDTLFAAGCGRSLEGTAGQMWTSLQKLAALPQETFVYCGHDYTLDNCEFACSVAPDDVACRTRLEETKALCASGRPTVPSTIRQERLTNLFLRARNVDEFARLRRLKDEW